MEHILDYDASYAAGAGRGVSKVHAKHDGGWTTRRVVAT